MTPTPPISDQKVAYIGEDWNEPEMQIANRMDKQLRDALGNDSRWMDRYRVYLDKLNIRAEVDGWPSPEAKSQFNIRNFIKRTLNAREN